MSRYAIRKCHTQTVPLYVVCEKQENGWILRRTHTGRAEAQRHLEYLESLEEPPSHYPLTPPATDDPGSI